MPMPEAPIKNLLPHLDSRRDYFDYLDRWTVGTVEELRSHMSSRALVKAFLLETSRCNGSRDAVLALDPACQRMSQVDETFYRLRWPGEDADWALVEVEDQRYPILYTALDRNTANDRVDHIIRSSPLLDRAWFATPMFQHLWQLVIDAYPAHRFSKIVFEHESVFEVALGEELSTSEEENEESLEDVGEEVEVERRRARMQITERIGKLDKALKKMRPEYDPLESIVSLRIPAPRHGGHDVYYDGRFTNRSDSVSSLRQTIEVVTGIYRYSTEKAEQASWPQTEDPARPTSLGMPLLVKFSQELDLGTFERWTASFRRKNNRFRLWGNPIQMGPGKVHVYAVDNHLWQPIDIEITLDHLYALIPSGTCGNTIHRLVTNIQRFVDPKLKTYIGDRNYDDFIAQAPLNAGSGYGRHA